MCASETMSAEFVLADSAFSGFFRVLAVTRGFPPVLFDPRTSRNNSIRGVRAFGVVFSELPYDVQFHGSLHDRYST